LQFRPLAPVVLALGLTACSQTPAIQSPQQADATPPGQSPFPLQVEAVTTSWRLADDHEDGTCTWHEPTYAVMDGAGTVVDVGGLEVGEGQVREVDGEASCVLEVTIPAPPADVYEVEITVTAPESNAGGRSMPGGGEEYSGSAMISRTDAADEAVVVTVEGPSPIY